MQQLYLNNFFHKNPTTGEFIPIAGIAGESAYEIAVRLGTFTGTEEEWNNYIEIERDKAIADIIAKATEARESIPEDYTAISEQVSGKIDKTSIAQGLGDDPEKVVSQKAATRTLCATAETAEEASKQHFLMNLANPVFWELGVYYYDGTLFNRNCGCRTRKLYNFKDIHFRLDINTLWYVKLSFFDSENQFIGEMIYTKNNLGDSAGDVYYRNEHNYKIGITICYSASSDKWQEFESVESVFENSGVKIYANGYTALTPILYRPSTGGNVAFERLISIVDNNLTIKTGHATVLCCMLGKSSIYAKTGLSIGFTIKPTFENPVTCGLWLYNATQRVWVDKVNYQDSKTFELFTTPKEIFYYFDKSIFNETDEFYIYIREHTQTPFEVSTYELENFYVTLGYCDDIEKADEIHKIVIPHCKDGEDGKDGVTPAFKVENAVLYVSYDSGSTWTSLGDITDEKPLFGKKYNACGDSITHQGKYLPIVANLTGVTYTNIGLSSSTIAVNNTYLTNKSIVERACGLNGNPTPTPCDIWTIMGGLNDCLYKSTLGTLVATGSVFDTTTIYGALQTICEFIISRGEKLVLLTPMHSVRDTWSKDTYGITMEEIRNAIIKVGEYYGVTVLDLWCVSGINAFNFSSTAPDGVHPNDYGTSLYAHKIAKSLVAEFAD